MIIDQSWSFPCRVRFSKEGIENLRQYVPADRRQRTGMAIKQRPDECITVIWDGTKTYRFYHKAFLEVLVKNND